MLLNKVIKHDLITDNVVFTRKCFVLPITNPIILGNDFLDIYFTVLDIGDHIIILHCADCMLSSSLTHNSAHDWQLVRILVPATTEVLYK